MHVCMYVAYYKRYYKRHKAKQIIKIIPTKSSCSKWLDNHTSAWHWLSFSLLFNFYIQTQQYAITLISERILAPFVQFLWQESFCYSHVLKNTSHVVSQVFLYVKSFCSSGSQPFLL